MTGIVVVLLHTSAPWETLTPVGQIALKVTKYASCVDGRTTAFTRTEPSVAIADVRFKVIPCVLVAVDTNVDVAVDVVVVAITVLVAVLVATTTLAAGLIFKGLPALSAARVRGPKNPVAGTPTAF